jgi:hypothetical protein
VIQIDFSLLLKLAFGVYLLSQGGGEQRLAFLIACAIAIYMYVLSPSSPFLNGLYSSSFVRYVTGVGRRVEIDEHGNPVDPPPNPLNQQRARTL